MRRLYAWIAGAAGGLAAYRLARRRVRAALEPPASPGEVDPRAEELRARLDESRRHEIEEPESAAPSPPPALSEADDPDARRRAVHEHGRSTVEAMRAHEESSEDP